MVRASCLNEGIEWTNYEAETRSMNDKNMNKNKNMNMNINMQDDKDLEKGDLIWSQL